MAENNNMGNFMVGAVVGAALALLLAPMAGGDARRQLGGAARKLKDGAVDAMDHVKGMVKEGASGVNAAVDSGADALRRGVDKATQVGSRG